MKAVKLKFKRDTQGWQSEFEGKLVVTSNFITYRLSNEHGYSTQEVESTVKLSLDSFGGFYVAY